MRRLTLLISGNVQKVGYRDMVIRFGTALGLTGYAENLPDGRVKVAAEGDEQKIELLRECANIRDSLINVEKIEGSFSEATGEFSYFYKLVKEGETDERLDKAAELFKQLIGVVESGFKETVSAINSVKADTSAIREEMKKGFMENKEEMKKGFAENKEEMKKGFAEVKEEMKKGFAEVKEEMKKGFGDMRHGFGEMKKGFEDVRHELSEIKEATNMQREDFKEVFMHEVSDLRVEIAQIKGTLIRMQQAAEA